MDRPSHIPLWPLAPSSLWSTPSRSCFWCSVPVKHGPLRFRTSPGPLPDGRRLALHRCNHQQTARKSSRTEKRSVGNCTPSKPGSELVRVGHDSHVRLIRFWTPPLCNLPWDRVPYVPPWIDHDTTRERDTMPGNCQQHAPPGRTSHSVKSLTTPYGDGISRLPRGMGTGRVEFCLYCRNGTPSAMDSSTSDCSASRAGHAGSEPRRLSLVSLARKRALMHELGIALQLSLVRVETGIIQ